MESPPSETDAKAEVLDSIANDSIANDSIANDSNGNDSTNAVLPSDSRLWIGINEFAETMMGTAPVTVGKTTAPFHWVVPSAGGFTLQVHVEHSASWNPKEAPSLRCVWPGRTDATSLPALDSVTIDKKWLQTEAGHTWTAKLTSWPADAIRLDGTIPCEHIVATVQNVDSAPLQLASATLTKALDPFDEVDRWLLDFSRDGSALTVTYKDGDFAVPSANPGKPNGVADFDEALTVLGFMGGDAAWKTTMRDHFRERVRRLLRQFYGLDEQTGAIGDDSVRIRFAFNGDSDAPEKPLSTGWSILAVGGEDSTYKDGGQTFFGRANMDFHNSKANYNTTPNLGIFTTAIARLVLESPALSNLVVDYAPASNGTAFGDAKGDELIFDPKIDPTTLKDTTQADRIERFQLMAPLLALALGAVIAHEVGHSIGLVKPGFPPSGLFGGVTKAPWMTAIVDQHHVDTPGLNIMQTGASLKPQDLFAGKPYFTAFNLAYLRRRIVVQN